MPINSLSQALGLCFSVALLLSRPVNALTATIGSSDSTFVVGESDTYVIEVSTTKQESSSHFFRMEAGTTFQIVIPSQIDTGLTTSQTLTTCTEEYTKNNAFPNPATVVTGTPTCTYTSGAQQFFSYTTTFNQADGTIDKYKIYFGPFQNPGNTAAVSTFEIYITSGGTTESKDSGLRPSYDAATWSSAGLGTTSNSAGAIVGSDYTFTFVNRNVISAGGYVELKFPTEFYDVTGIVAASTVTVTVAGNVKSGKVLSVTNQVLKITNIFSTDFTSSSTLLVVLQGLENPGEIVLTGSFKITSFDASGNSIDVTDSGMTVNISQAGTITISSFQLYDLTTGSDTVFNTGNEAYIDVSLTPSVLGSDGGYFEFKPPANFFFAASSSTNIATISGIFDPQGVVEDGSALRYMVNPQEGADSNTELRIQLGFWTIGYAATAVAEWDISLRSAGGGIVAQATSAALALTDYTVTGQALTNVNIVRDSATLSNQPTKLTITFTPATTIISGNKLKVTIPSDAATFLAADTVGCETGTGTALVCTKDTAGPSVTIISPCGSSACTGGSAATVVITGLTNPSAIALTETSFALESFTTIDNVDYTTDSFSGSVTVSSFALTPGVLTDITIARDNAAPETGGDVTWTFQARLQTAVTRGSGAGLRIIFPAGVAYMPNSQDTTSDGFAVGKSYVADAGDPLEIEYVDVYACELTSTSACLAGDLLTITVAAKYAYQNGNPASLLFTFRSIQNGAYSDEGTGTAASFSINPHAFTSTPVIESDDAKVVGDTISLRYKVTTFNRLPSLADNGKLTVTLPTEMSASGCTCSATDQDSNTLTCSYTSNVFTVTTTNEISGGKEIIVQTSDCVTLPPTGAPTSAGFVFATFEGSNEIDLENSAAFQADTPNAITTATVARGPLPTAAEASAVVEYTIKFTPTNPLPSAANGGLIKVYVPTSQIISAPALSPAVSGATIQSHGTTTYNSISYYAVLLSSVCGGCAEPSFTLTGFNNIGSTAAPSSSWVIETYVDSEANIIDRIDSGVLATPYIREGTLDGLSIQRVGDTVGTTMTLTFGMTLQNGLDATNRIFISFPSMFVYQGSTGPTCTLEGNNEATCTVTPAQDDFGPAVAFLTVSNANCAACRNDNTAVTLVVSGLLNPYSLTQISSGSISISTMTAGGDIRDAGEISFTSNPFNALTAATLTLNSVDRSVATVGAETQIQLSITLASNMEATGIMIVYIPVLEFVATGATIQWTSTTSSGTFTGTAGTEANGLLPVTITAPCGSSICTGQSNGGAAFGLTFTQGFRNVGYEVVQSTYFDINTYTSGSVLANTNTANTVATTTTISATTITLSSMQLASDLVGASTTLTIPLKFTAKIEGDKNHNMVFTFDTPFFRNDNTFVCTDGNGNSLTCSSTPTSDLVSTLTISNLCSSDCAASSNIEINIANVVNFLEVYTITGTVSVVMATTDSENIATVSNVNYSDMEPITKNFLTSPTVTRSEAEQGADATYTISFTLPGILQQDPVILLSLPLNQIVIKDGQSAFNVLTTWNAAITHTVPTADGTNNFIKISGGDYPCGTANCASGTVLSFILTSAANPFVSTSNPDDFIIQIYNAAESALIFDSSNTSPLDASPDLEVGAITDMSLTHGASDTSNVELTRTGADTDYSFTFTTSGTVPSGGFFRITTPEFRAVASGATFACEDGNGNAFTCSGAVNSDNEIVISITCASGCAAGTYTFKVTAGLQNPGFVPECGVPTTYWLFETTAASGQVINSGQIQCSEASDILFTELDFSQIEVKRDSENLATGSVYTFSFRVATALSAGGKFRLVLDTNQVSNALFATCPSATCSSPFQVGEDQVWIIVEQNCDASVGCAANENVSVVLQNTRNPSTLTANYPTTSFEIYTLNEDGFPVDGYNTNIKAVDDLVAEKVQISQVRLEDLYTNTNTNITVRFAPGHDLAYDGKITLTLPDGFAFPSEYDDQCYVDKLVDTAVACTFTLDDNNEYLKSVALSRVCPSSGCTSDHYYGFKFPVLTKHDNYPLDGLNYFFIVTSEDGVDVAIGERVNNIRLDPFQLSVFEAFADDGCDKASDYCTLNLKFKFEHNVPRSSANGRILITLPSEIRLESRSCNAVYGSMRSSRITCQGYYRTAVGGNDQLIVLQDSFDTMYDQNFTVRIQQIRNPPTSAPTSDIIVLSQRYYDSGTDTSGNSLVGWYDVEGTLDLDDAFTYKVANVQDLRRVSVTRYPLDDGSGYLAGNPTKLLVEIWPRKEIDNDASFIVQFPEGAQLALNPKPVTKTCFSATSLGFELDRVYCETFPANRTVIVRNYCVVTDVCSSGQPVVRFVMSNDFIMNYPIVVEPLDDVEHSLNVLVTTDRTYYYSGQRNRKIFVEPELKPNALIFINPEIIRTNSYVNSQTSWVINFKTNTNAVDAGGSLVLAIPKDIMMYMGEVPLVKNYTDDAWTEVPDIEYTLYSDELSIASVTVPNFCKVTCEPGKAYSISFERFRNPRSQLTSRESITLTTVDAGGYLIERGVTKPATEVFSQLLPVRLQNVIIRPADPVPGKTTSYTFSFSADAEFSYSDVLYIIFPTETEVLGHSGRRCEGIFSPDVFVNCFESSRNVVKVLGLFPENSKQYAVTVQSVRNMAEAGSTSNFQLEVRSSGGSFKAAKTTQLRAVMLEEIEDQTECNRVCGSCAGTTTTCTSCTIPSKYPVWKRNTCVNSCSDGFFFNLDSKTCFDCHHACSTCHGPGNNRCNDCAKGYFMNDGQCLDFCPTGFTADEETRQCVAPQDQTGCNEESNCQTCGKDTSVCISCDEDSAFPILDRTTGKCIENDPSLCNDGDSSRWFIEGSSRECRKCNALCKTCHIQENKCTSCWDFFTTQLVNELYETCVDRCGLGTFLNETAEPQKCQFCNPVCLTCEGSSPKQCTACNETSSGRQLYLDGSQCVLQCPRGAETNTQVNTCDKGVADVSGFWFPYLCLSAIIVVGLTIMSRFKSKKADNWMEILAALLSGVEFFTRFFLLGNLWISSSVFLLALGFMDMISTSVIGIFFNFLYMQPIYDHSPHFRTLFRRSRNAWIGVTIASYFGGVHLMRLLTSKFLGKQAFSADLHTQKFYRQPLNLMSNATTLFTIFQLILDLSCFYYFALSEDSFGLALVSFLSCGALLIMQFSFHLKTKRFVSEFDAKKTNDVLRNKIQRFAEENPVEVPSESDGPQAEGQGGS